MALFKSEKEKAAAAAEKEQKLLAKYNMDQLKDPIDIESVRLIASEMAGSGLMEAGIKLSFAKPEVQLPISYQRCLMEQNFIIIRQLDKISTQLAELCKETPEA